MVKIADFPSHQAESKFNYSSLTRLERWLLLALLIAFLICIVLTCIIFLFQFQGKKACSTKWCVQAAAEIMEQIDERVSPCENFYAFACGGLDNEFTVIPEDRSNMWTASLYQVKINSKFKTLLEKIDTTEGNETYMTKMKTLYDLCMDKDSLELLGNAPLLSVLNQLGGWPVLEGSSWNEANFDLIDRLVDMRKLGYGGDLFAKITVAPHIFFQEYNVLYIGEADLALEERSYYEKGIEDLILSNYLRFMVKSCIYLGADEALAESEMRRVLELEISLAMMTKGRDELYNIFNPMNIEQVQRLTPNFNWTQYFNGMFDPYAVVNNESYVIVYVPSYLEKLNGFLKQTDSRVLANYLLWRVVMSSTVLMNEKWALIGREFYQNIDGRKSLKPRYSFCLETVKKYYNLGASGLYVQNSPNHESNNLMSIMVKYIKQAFVDIVQSTDWMDQETMNSALNKTRLMTLHIGHPKELESFDLINEHYEQVPSGRNNTWFEMILFLRRWKKDLDYAKILVKNEKGRWLDYANVIDVNAYYRHQENSIQFPSSIIEATGINQHRPMYLNFGSIGWIIGHEITHGFDTIGRRFDAAGQYKNWWTDKTGQMFESRAQCFAEQYGNYTLMETGDQIDGKRTLSENIADNGGLKEAYKAYQRYVKDHGPEPMLPGLDYNADQLFFIKSANFYCGKWRTPSLSYMIKTDEHSPGLFRILGTMSNMAEFSNAFGCDRNTTMNPVKKCTLW